MKTLQPSYRGLLPCFVLFFNHKPFIVSGNKMFFIYFIILPGFAYTTKMGRGLRELPHIASTQREEGLYSFIIFKFRFTPGDIVKHGSRFLKIFLQTILQFSQHHEIKKLISVPVTQEPLSLFSRLIYVVPSIPDSLFQHGSHWVKIKVSVGLYFLVEVLGENVFPSLFQILEATYTPWLVAPPLSPKPSLPPLVLPQLLFLADAFTSLV